MTIGPKAVQEVAEHIRALLRNMKFEPEFSALVLTQVRVFGHTNGYLIPDSKVYDKLIKQLRSHSPTVAEKTIIKYTDDAIQVLLDEIVDVHKLGWDKRFTLGETQLKLVNQERVALAIKNILSDLSSLVKDYTVFIPLMGVELLMPKYDFGSVSLVRTTESMPVLEEADGSAEFQYVHSAVHKHFTSVSCIVQTQITGDTEFAYQEGARQAGQLAAILNLHLGVWLIQRGDYQKIQCAGVPLPNARVILVRTDLADDSGVQRPTYLPSVMNLRIFSQKLDQTQLNAVKATGFDAIWQCFEQSNRGSKSLSERIRRSVIWFDKAVNFDEPDAQFVGLATALEILLVGESNIHNPSISWSGITQQLADKCAFLLGHDLESILEVVESVKRLYKIRSGIVHGGKEPTTSELNEMIDLASRVILDFVQRGFSSFDHFEEWIKRLHYSVNLNEIERYRETRN